MIKTAVATPEHISLTDLIRAMKQTNGDAGDTEGTKSKAIDMLATVAEQAVIAHLKGASQGAGEDLVGNLLFVTAAFAVAYDVDLQKILDERYEAHKALSALVGIEVK